MTAPLVLTLGAKRPSLAPTAWVAPGAAVIGDVRLEEGVSVYYQSALRGDIEYIEIGARTNLQDSVVVHTDHGMPTIVGEGVSVGHAAVLHGCTIGNGCLIGMGATVMSGAVIGARSMVAAGALVTPRKVFGEGVLIAGAPARVLRDLRADELEHLAANAELYLRLTAEHRAATTHLTGC